MNCPNCNKKMGSNRTRIEIPDPDFKKYKNITIKIFYCFNCNHVEVNY